MAQPKAVTINERTQVTHWDQFYKAGEGNVFFVKDDIYYATAYVFDENAEDSTTAIYTESLAVGDVFFDTPQLDASWDQDDVGYNFKWTAPSVAFPEGGHTYRVEIFAHTVSDSVVESIAPNSRVFYVKTRGTSA